MVVGWYHSHPGFGCWLSGVDINTQQVRLDFILYVTDNNKNYEWEILMASYNIWHAILNSIILIISIMLSP